MNEHNYLIHRSHKYLDRKWSHGRWNYTYEDDRKKRANYNLNIPDTAHTQHIQTHGYNAYDTGVQYALVPATHDPNKDKLKEAMNNAHGHTVHKETDGSQKEQVGHGPHGVENVGSNTKEHEPKKEQSTFDKIKETARKTVYHIIQNLTGKPNSMSTYVKDHIKNNYPHIRYWLDYNGILYNPARNKKTK